MTTFGLFWVPEWHGVLAMGRSQSRSRLALLKNRAAQEQYMNYIAQRQIAHSRPAAKNL